MTEIVVVNSFRGGTGKSTITSNLASFLASSGKRVVIIDSDINSPSIHTLFGLGSSDFSETFSDYIFGKCRINDTVYDISNVLGLPEDQILLVPASTELANIAHNISSKKNQNMVRKAIDEINLEFGPDYIFIDTHPGINEQVLLVTSLADKVLTVIRPDRQDYAGSAVSAEVTSKLGNKSFFIMNKVHRKLNQSRVKKSIEDNLKINIVGALPFDEEILFSESRYIIVMRYPEHKFSQVIKRLAAKVFGIEPKEYIEVIYNLLKKIKKNKNRMTAEKIFLASKLRKNVFDDYFRLIQEKGLVMRSNDKEPYQYVVSPRGHKYLSEYSVIVNFIGNFGL